MTRPLRKGRKRRLDDEVTFCGTVRLSSGTVQVDLRHAISSSLLPPSPLFMIAYRAVFYPPYPCNSNPPLNPFHFVPLSLQQSNIWNRIKDNSDPKCWAIFTVDDVSISTNGTPLGLLYALSNSSALTLFFPSPFSFILNRMHPPRRLRSYHPVDVAWIASTSTFGTT